MTIVLGWGLVTHLLAFIVGLAAGVVAAVALSGPGWGA